MEPSLSVPLLDAAAQACAPAGEAAEIHVAPDGPIQRPLSSSLCHLRIKDRRPPNQAACAMQGLEVDQSPHSPNAFHGKADLFGTNLNPAEPFQAMQPPDGTCNTSASPSVEDLQDQDGSPFPDGQASASSCKLITYYRRAKGGLQEALLPLPDAQRSCLIQLTVFTPRRSKRLAASCRKNVLVTERIQLQLAARLGLD